MLHNLKENINYEDCQLLPSWQTIQIDRVHAACFQKYTYIDH